MNRLLLIIQREFLIRIRKKIFWIMSFAGPFLFALGLIVPLWFGTTTTEEKVIEVFDQTGYVQYKLSNTSDIKFAYFNGDPQQRIAGFLSSDHYALIHIPKLDLQHPEGIVLYSKTQPSLEVKFYLEKIIGQTLTIEKIRQSGVDPKILQSLDTRINIQSQSVFSEWQDEGELTASVVVALFSSILILFFILMYGGQVMRGVIEEKTNRIIEVMISTVKPFELMMGKILGIALVSLAQFTIWISLTATIAFFVNTKYGKVFEMYSDRNIENTLKANPGLDAEKAMEINEVVSSFKSIKITRSLLVFLFYFIFGYLLYSALFASIGSAVDVETDTQQFVFPLIAPLMFCMVMATSIVGNPHDSLAYWLSVIPFTSPVGMMLRLPFDVPIPDLVTSMVLLFITFILITLVAGRIYRVGILMYGKKTSLPELAKWIFYKR